MIVYRSVGAVCGLAHPLVLLATAPGAPGADLLAARRPRRVTVTSADAPKCTLATSRTDGSRHGFGRHAHPPRHADRRHEPGLATAEMINAEVVHAAEAGLGEGCIWSPVEDLLVWVDINGKAVHRFDHATGQPVGLWRYPDTVGNAAIRAGGGLALGLGVSVTLTDQVGAIESVIQLPGEPETNRANDGAVDPRGRLFQGTIEQHRARIAGGGAAPRGWRRHGPAGALRCDDLQRHRLEPRSGHDVLHRHADVPGGPVRLRPRHRRDRGAAPVRDVRRQYRRHPTG